ncbi:hypothetical protein pipiens_001297 [Culex pipiens pipiens]|uniref:Secreted protein n=1 Tax=Culex pipiens pipiens TaxID=38569 RepID=A0ABD1D521_CULPP
MMRSIWAFVLFVKLIEGLPATSSRCELGFEEVLTGRHCDYFAVGPQALLDSYCSWDNQLSHGITQKFCCLGVCAFCFSDVNRSFESKYDETFIWIVQGDGGRQIDANDGANGGNNYFW